MFLFGKNNIYNYVADCTNLLRLFCCFFAFGLVFYVFFVFAFPCECLFVQLAQYWGTCIYPIGAYACSYVGGCLYRGFLACLVFVIDLLIFYRSSTYCHFCHVDRCVMAAEIIRIGAYPPF